MAFKKRKKDEKKNRKFTNVGALWRTKNGSKAVIASGTLQPDGDRDGESFDILLMKNDKDGNEKRPDYRIVIVTDDDDDDDDDDDKGKKSKKDDDDLPF